MDGQSSKEKEFDERLLRLAEDVEKLGVRQLADDIQDERFLRKVLEGEVFINSNSIQEIIDEKNTEELFERLLQFQMKLFDKSATYNNIVVTLGYAGIFAIWGFANESLTIFDRNLVAVLLGISLAVFIIWTISVSWKLSLNSRQTLKVYKDADGDGEELTEKLKIVEGDQHQSMIKFLMWYPFAFISSTALGFFAGFYLIFLLGTQLLGLNCSLSEIFK